MDRFSHGLFIDAARQAMALVEDELRRKGGCTSKLYGTNLVKHIFGRKDPMRLRAVLDPDQHDKAQKLFVGAFEYYRNFVMHHSSGIDRDKSITIMLVASELMWLIGAGIHVFRGRETLEQLVNTGRIDSLRQLGSVLQFLEGQYVLDESWDGLWETLAYNGISPELLELVGELGFVEWRRGDVDPLYGDWRDPDFMDMAELTDDGKEALRLCLAAQPYGDLDVLRSPSQVFGDPPWGKRAEGNQPQDTDGIPP